MGDLRAINSKLKSLSVTSGFNKLTQQTSGVASAVQALNASSLGSTLNENISGIQALNTTNNALKSVSILTENITGLQSQIVKDVSASKTDLDAITGATVSNGFLDVVVTSATAEGVKTSINAIATPSDKELNTILTNVVPKQYSAQVDDIVKKDFINFTQDFSSSVSSFTSSFSNLLGAKTGNVLQDIIFQTDNTPISIIENLGVPADQSGDIFNLLQNGKFNEAVSQAAKITGKSTAVVEATLNTVPTSLSKQVQTAAVGSSSTGTFDVSSKNNKWQGASTPSSYFDIIATQEQLHIEMIKCSREVTELIFFGHETTANQVLTASDIHDTYNEDGNDGIPFHFVVLPNGNIQRGRSLSTEGNYSTTHKKFSIGIVIPHVVGAPATSMQGESVIKIFESFYNVWPGGQVFDAEQDTDDSEVKVGVPIESLLASFKKENYGNSSRSFSTAQLISSAQGNI